MKHKGLKIIITILIVLVSSFAFLLYGPYDKFRSWLITTAMTTMTHQYLATTFYSENTINKVLSQNKVVESEEDTDASSIKFEDYKVTNSMFLNKYDEEVLEKKDGQKYKLININEGNLRGYLAIIYDPSKVKIALSSKMGKNGELLTTIAKNNNALIAMNASAFIDPNYNSNGAVPWGAVIKDSTIVNNQKRISSSGGIIGFNKENKLILSHMSPEEAVNEGIRDAIDFGPFLIVNGKASFIKGNGGWGQAPRSAIGQRKDGIVLFLVMDGRDYKNGVPGADMVDMTEIMLRYGAYNAANLDGGTSSGLVINNKLINKPINGHGENNTRAIPDAWILEK